jgi:hypothetical protein
MATWDDLIAKLRQYGQPPAVSVPPRFPDDRPFSDFPEPGTPAGKASSADGIILYAADGTPLFDSGVHMYQPRDVGEGKWTSRYRRVLRLQAGLGIQDYPATLLAAVMLNQFNPEDFFPDEQLFVAFGSAIQTAANVSLVEAFMPGGTNTLAIVESLTAFRVNTPGLIGLFEANGQRAQSNNQGGGISVRDLRLDTGGAVGGVSSQLVIRENVSATGTSGSIGEIETSGGAAGVLTPVAVFKTPFVISPGRGIDLQPEVLTAGIPGGFVNEGLIVSLSWRERAA